MTSELRRRPNVADGVDASKPGSSPYHFLVSDANNSNESEKNEDAGTYCDDDNDSKSTDKAPSTNDDNGGGGFNFFGLFTPPKKKEPTAGPPVKNTRILIEVVACQNLLPVTDLIGNKANDLLLTNGAGNPYATIRMPTSQSRISGSAAPIIHKTRPSRSKTLSPIWTVRTSSLYLLLVNDKEFELSAGLTFEVLTGRGALLPFSHGQVTVPPEIILEGKGERLEFHLKSEEKEGADDTPSKDTDEHEKVQNVLALRFRRATEEDMQFMLAVQKGQDLQKSINQMTSPTANGKNNSQKNENEEMDAFDKKLFVGGASDFQFKQERPPRGHRQKKTAKQLNLVEIRGGAKGDESVEKEELVRVQPYPDPDREAETTWLSPKEIETEAMSASKKWIKAGKGAFGTCFGELIVYCLYLESWYLLVSPRGPYLIPFYINVRSGNIELRWTS